MKLNPFTLGTAAALLLAIFGPGPWPGFGMGPWLDRICLALAFGAVCFGCLTWFLRSHCKRLLADTRSKPAPPELAILRERYARGEIDRKQYMEMLHDLRI